MIEVIYALVAVGYFLGLDKEDDGEFVFIISANKSRSARIDSVIVFHTLPRLNISGMLFVISNHHVVNIVPVMLV